MKILVTTVSFAALRLVMKSGFRQLKENQRQSGTGSRERLCCVCWNFESVIRFELVPNGRTIDADHYALNSIKCTQSWVTNIRHPLIGNETDHPKPQATRQMKEKIKELGAIELIPHPAYSADLAPSHIASI